MKTFSFASKCESMMDSPTMQEAQYEWTGCKAMMSVWGIWGTHRKKTGGMTLHKTDPFSCITVELQALVQKNVELIVAAEGLSTCIHRKLSELNIGNNASL